MFKLSITFDEKRGGNLKDFLPERSKSISLTKWKNTTTLNNFLR